MPVIRTTFPASHFSPSLWANLSPISPPFQWVVPSRFPTTPPMVPPIQSSFHPSNDIIYRHLLNSITGATFLISLHHEEAPCATCPKRLQSHRVQHFYPQSSSSHKVSTRSQSLPFQKANAIPEYLKAKLNAWSTWIFTKQLILKLTPCKDIPRNPSSWLRWGRALRLSQPLITQLSMIKPVQIAIQVLRISLLMSIRDETDFGFAGT